MVDRIYETFRCWELRQYDRKGKLLVVIGATVPKTGDWDHDLRAAMEMIDVQTCERSGEFWPGRISTDADFSARLVKIKERRAVRAIDRQITTALVDRLLEEGYRITCCVRQDEPRFENSKARNGILKFLSGLEMAELHVQKAGKTYWIMLIFDEAGWDVIADYSADLTDLVDPILEPFLPWNKPGAAAVAGYSVFVLPSPAELDRGDPAAEKAVTDFFKTMEELF